MSWGVALRNAVGLGLGGIPSLRKSGPYPKISFDFTKGTLDPLITFTRASSATYFDSAGVLQTAGNNVARFDYNPSTLAARGLLIEEQRTNLCLYSNDLNQAPWGKGLTVSLTYDTATAPDGTKTADTITVVSGADTGVYQNITCASSTTYTWSLYVKLGTMAASDYKIAIYDNTNLAFIAVDIVPTQTPSSTVWTRITYTFTTPATCVSVRPYCFRNSLSAATSVNVWGMQLEQGAFATSYIPTSTTALTRSADVAAITGANFTNWFNSIEGTMVVSATVTSTTTDGTTRVLASIGDSSTFNETIYLARSSSSANITANVIDGGVAQWTSNTLGSATVNTPFKTAMAYKLNDLGGSFNGAAAVTDNVATIPTVNSLSLGNGSWSGAVNYINGYLQSFAYYPTRLRNGTLQALTS